MAASTGTIVNRQKLRLTILFLMVLSFPILMNYMSVFIIIDGSSKGVLTFSFLFWTSWFVSALVLGRAACGWMCPLGAYQETKDRMAPKNLAQIKGLKWIKYVFAVAWVGAVVYAGTAAGGFHSVDLMYYTESGVSVAVPQSWFTWGTIVLAILIPAFLIGRRGFCHYFCPWGVLNMGATRIKNFFGWPSLHLIAQKERCKQCRTCRANCPMSLSVGDMMKTGSVKNDECILCGTCVDNCPNAAISYRWKHESNSMLN